MLLLMLTNHFMKEAIRFPLLDLHTIDMKPTMITFRLSDEPGVTSGNVAR
jgi:hypothetical protein